PSVAPLSLGPLKEGEPLFPVGAGYVISAIVAVAGLGIARALYSQHLKTGELMSEAAKARNPLYNLFANKWYFDPVYEFIFIKIGGWFADRILWRTIDVGLIDGIVNGAAGLVGGVSKVGRRLQTGYVRNYALGMLLGVVLLVAGLVYTYNTLTMR